MSEHCSGCQGYIVRLEERTGTGQGLYSVPVYDTPCPGLQCNGCSAKDAEIARLIEHIDQDHHEIETYRHAPHYLQKLEAALAVADEMAALLGRCAYIMDVQDGYQKQFIGARTLADRYLARRAG